MNAKKLHVGDATFSRYVRFRIRNAFRGSKVSKQQILDINEEDM